MSTVSLTRANTLRLPSHAERAIVVTCEDDLLNLGEALARTHGDTPVTVLGGGSNVVLRRRLTGVVCLMRTRGIRQESAGEQVQVTVAAGERWHDLVRYTLGQGLFGLENLALIPGAVGAAPIQNIGAYGVELSDLFVRLRALDVRTGRIREFQRDDCRFGYRDSYFKRPEAAGLVILDVTLALTRRAVPVVDYPDLELELSRLGWTRPSPAQVAEAVIRVRRRKLPDPRFIGNAGSFFKNPRVSGAEAAALRRRLPGLSERVTPEGDVKLSAAQLIDRCGFKGHDAGSVGVWHRQPLVLINRGGATGAEVLALGETIRREVASRFGVSLELEPRVIGQD